MTRSDQKGLFRHGLILMAATQVGNLSNLLFHVAMGRALDLKEYGVLVAMQGIILIISTPMSALQMAMAHFSALLVQRGQIGAIERLVRRWSRNLALPILAILGFGILFRHPLAAFFHLDHPMPVILTCFVLSGALLTPILVGALLGLQSFLWMSVCQHIWGVVRLTAGAALVLLVSARSEWGLASHALGVCVSAIVGVWGLRWNIKSAPSTEEPIAGMTRYFIQSLFILSGFGVLMNADIVMVKHFFPDPQQAGLFARAATIGRTMVFLPMPIALAMFPKVASDGAIEAHNWKTLFSAIFYVTVILAAAALMCSIYAWVPLWILYKDRAPTLEMIRLVRGTVCAMTPLGLTYLLMNFQMAQRRFKPASFLLVCAAGYVTGVSLFHETLWQVIIILGIASVLSAVALILGLPWKRKI